MTNEVTTKMSAASDKTSFDPDDFFANFLEDDFFFLKYFSKMDFAALTSFLGFFCPSERILI